MLGLLSQKDLAEQLRQYFDRTVYSCQTYHTTWSSVDKKKIMSAFIGKAQEEYKEESQKNSLLVLTLSKKNLLSHLYWGTQWTIKIS